MAQGARAGPCRRCARSSEGTWLIAERSIAAAARGVLDTVDPVAKVRAARAVARAWRRGELHVDFDVAMPDRPPRPSSPELLPPARMPKRGKGGSERGRLALLHALAHI